MCARALHKALARRQLNLPNRLSPVCSPANEADAVSAEVGFVATGEHAKRSSRPQSKLTNPLHALRVPARECIKHAA